MKKIVTGALIALVAVMSAQAAGPRDRVRADSMADSGRHRRTPPNPENAVDTPVEADVGDADSFGRAVKYLGFAQSEFAAVLPDCSTEPPGTCVSQTDPTAGVGVVWFGPTAVIKLPPRAAKSLLCFAFTPQGYISVSNNSAQSTQVSARIGANWRIESEVLNDPTLIDPATGLPFGGALSSGTSLEFLSRSVAAGDNELIVPTHSRTCISGHLSRRFLMGQGLSEAQAREVFRKPITIRFGASASASNAQVVSGFGVRIYGD